VAVVLGFALLIYPFYPRIQYALFPPEPEFPYATRLLDPESGIALAEVDNANLPDTPGKPVPQENRLVIPKIGVDVNIAEGETDAALWRGIWRIPGTSNPEAGGNTVLSGHRFQYLPPNSRTLYLMDKLEPGDLIIVYWKGKEYDYRVTEKKVILPTQTEILDNTPDDQLTLFTCTPLFSTKNRLVVFSERIP
jgi:LPXTG-site transpeptidase (sortase) family protein